VWEVFASHLRSGRLAGSRENRVTLKGVDGNLGIAG
jgi:hypothetical protein